MFKKKCFICSEKDKKKNMGRKTVYYYGFTYTYYYHSKCLQVASCNAKNYSTGVLELVNDIINKSIINKEYREKILSISSTNCKEFQGKRQRRFTN